MEKLIINTDPGVRIDFLAKKDKAFKIVLVLLTKTFRAFTTTGYTFSLIVKNTAGSAVLTFEAGSGITISENVVTLLKDESDMNLDAGEYTYNFVSEKDGSQYDWMYGRFVVKNDVSLPDSTATYRATPTLKRIDDLLIGITYE